MLLFLLLCIASILVGVGILTAFRVPVPPAQRWLLGPAACLAAWAVVLGVAISFGSTARDLVVPFWIATAVAALYGWQARRSLPHEIGWLLALALVLPAGLMPFDFLHGLADFIGGPAADGWSYVARAQQLWEMPKDTLGHLAPLYQYASHLHATRFVASALLGVLSPFTGEAGDTQAATGYFLAFTVFVFGASCVAVASITRMRWPWLAAFCALAVMSRWVAGAIQIHNYDNLLAISFLPMTMGLVAGLETPNWRAASILGLFLAAAIYTYPEMAVFTVIGAVLSSARRAYSGPRPSAWIVMMMTGMAVALILLIPGRRDLTWFISNQVGAATAAVGRRAGEGAFAELLNMHNWGTGVWGLTSGVAAARFGSAWNIGARAIGLVCWILAAIGCIKLLRQRVWDVVLVGLMLMLGALVMIVGQQYSYGAYKFLLLGWWVLAWCVIAGAQALMERGRAGLGSARRGVWRVAAGASLAIALFGLLGSMTGRIVTFQRRLSTPSIRPYRAVLAVERAVGRVPLILAVNDPFANEWAVYFLRNFPLRLFGYQGPMAYSHVAPLMDQAAAPDLRTIQYVLSDAPPTTGSDVLWQQGPYALWRIPQTGAAFLRQVNNPNGAEQLDGQSFYWIGQGDTELEVYATSAGDAMFFCRFLRGPSLPDQPERHLIVGANGAAEQPFTIAKDGDQSFSFPVHAGENRIYVRALDRPSVMNIRGDTRPLLLGVQGLRVWLRPAVPQARLP